MKLREYVVNENSLFTDEEAAVIQEVMEALYDRVPTLPAFGNCIIDIQYEDGMPGHYEDAKCAIRFEMPNGPFRRYYFRIYDTTSQQLAEESIDEILKWPQECAYKIPNAVKFVPSGIYHAGTHEVMVMNASGGRLLLSCHTNPLSEGYVESDSLGFNADIALKLALMELFAQFVPIDRGLQITVRDILSKCNKADLVLADHVDAMISERQLPAIQAWLKAAQCEPETPEEATK